MTYLPRISPPDTAPLAGENMVVYMKGGSNIVVEYDLPIEDEWSDLTAKFELKSNGDGLFKMSMIDLRVL